MPLSKTAEAGVAHLFQMGTDTFGGHSFMTNKTDRTTSFTEVWRWENCSPYESTVFRVVVCGDGFLSILQCPLAIPEERIGEMEVFIAEFNSRGGRAKLAIKHDRRLVEAHFYMPAKLLLHARSKAEFDAVVNDLGAVPFDALSAAADGLGGIVGAG